MAPLASRERAGFCSAGVEPAVPRLALVGSDVVYGCDGTQLTSSQEDEQLDHRRQIWDDRLARKHAEKQTILDQALQETERHRVTRQRVETRTQQQASRPETITM